MLQNVNELWELDLYLSLCDDSVHNNFIILLYNESFPIKWMVLKLQKGKQISFKY